MDNSDWDLMARVWVSVDRTQHALSNYVAPDHPDTARNEKTATGAKVRDVYKQLDDAIGSFVSRTREDDIILFISDHGFQSVTRTIHMDHLLEEVRVPGVQRVEHAVRADAVGAGAQGRAQGVRHARAAREGVAPAVGELVEDEGVHDDPLDGGGRLDQPRGARARRIVDPGDFEKVRDEVMDRLASFVDPKTGKKPVKAIYKREQVFKGKHADTAPDILMEPEVGYSLTHAKTALEDADWISGDHRPEGTIVAVGPNVKPFDSEPYLIDMAPTILAALDAPASIKHTGRVLHEVVGAADVKQRADAMGQPAVDENAAAASAIPGMGGGDSTVSDTEADEMEEHLRGLGYLE